MKINSRAKGCRGEREWRDELRAQGFTARRGQQFSGSPDSPDVICAELPRIHFEVKRVEQGNLYKWMTQAVADAGTKTPVVAHRKSGEDWLVIMRAKDFLRILEFSGENI